MCSSDLKHIVGTSMRRYEERKSKSKRARERESERARERESREKESQRERERGKEKEPVIGLVWARGKERERRNPSFVVWTRCHRE